jgi:hypothetical protein
MGVVWHPESLFNRAVHVGNAVVVAPAILVDELAIVGVAGQRHAIEATAKVRLRQLRLLAPSRRAPDACRW